LWVFSSILQLKNKMFVKYDSYVRRYNGVRTRIFNFQVFFCRNHFFDRLNCSSGNNRINSHSAASRYINILPANLKIIIIIIIIFVYPVQVLFKSVYM
jgi:hypothetical protein